ncbi:MAG: alanine--glyoxylate aminotransferase family protein, partial [Vicinamibacteria bacterium]|nr:alanine--glyoxylate aminotransferase family protein [Vicinamibacteria bacterium]
VRENVLPMIAKTRLFTPGPTPLSPVVLQAMGKNIPHHRTDEFRAIFKGAREGLQRFFKTSQDVLILSCSGSGGMEAALVNTLSSGDTMLALVAGNFGERWANIGKAHGMDVQVLEAEWGTAVKPEAVKAALDANPKIRGVFVQHNESSTGVKHDIEAIASVVKGRADVLLVVDAISGMGAMPLHTEEWGVDVVVVGSQKALALPPGMAFVSVNEKAWQRIQTTKAPRFYFDLLRERKTQVNFESAWTPPISLVVALDAVLKDLEAAGGVDALVKNAGTLAAMTRAAALSLGLPLLAPNDYGDALTALKAPAGIEIGKITKILKGEFKSEVAGGQGKLKGQIMRVAHLGYYDVTDILGLIGTLEIALQKVGHKFTPGAGSAAATAEYLKRV